MNKEKQIQEYQSKQLIDELSKMPPMVIATAYLHAINYVQYWYRCDKCGKDNLGNTNFCPNCGAKMEVGE